MSKIPIGVYEDGSVKHCYFRRRKHNRIKRNGFSKIRRRMWIAKMIKTDVALDNYIEKWTKNKLLWQTKYGTRQKFH